MRRKPLSSTLSPFVPRGTREWAWRPVLRCLTSTALALVLASGALPLGAQPTTDAWKLPAEKADLKPGAGRELVVGQCVLCHSVDYITTQPRLARGVWQATVEKMRGKYGAPVPTNSVPALLDYLVAAYGAPAPAK